VTSCALTVVIDPGVDDVVKPNAEHRNCKLLWYVLYNYGLWFCILSNWARLRLFRGLWPRRDRNTCRL